MDDKKKNKPQTDADTHRSPKDENAKPQIKDIDDLIFADEYIKKHSEK